jgi:hypothetical protein
MQRFGGFARWRQRGFFNASNRRENIKILSTRDSAAILRNRSLYDVAAFPRTFQFPIFTLSSFDDFFGRRRFSSRAPAAEMERVLGQKKNMVAN